MLNEDGLKDERIPSQYPTADVEFDPMPMIL